jgi:hypothetical protein
MSTTYKNCQSCGMPLKKTLLLEEQIMMVQKAACIAATVLRTGQFKQPDWTAVQMQEFVKGKMKEMGFPGFLASFFSMNIPRLERWKNK